MLPEDDLTRLRHVLDAANDAIRFAADRHRADRDTDHMLLLSLLKFIEIVGEAASQVSARTQARRPCPQMPHDCNLV